MDSFEYNNIKDEKAQAMRNYDRQQMFKKLELVTALALLAWSSYKYIPADFLLQNVSVFGHPLYVFLAVNILIAVISVLSSQKPTKHYIYHDYVRSSTTTTTNKNNNVNVPRQSFVADEHRPASEVTVSKKQIVCVDIVVNSPVDQQSTVGATVSKDCEPVCPVRKSTVGTVTEVRRSEMLMKHTTEVKMDDLSSEEFRMTIDTFIAAKKKTLIKENSLDRNSSFTKLTENHV